MQHTYNDLPLTTREQMALKLSPQLTQMMLLHIQLKHAHWNVKGPNFIVLHELFDQVASDVLEGIDLIAERIRQLGEVTNLLQDLGSLAPPTIPPQQSEECLKHLALLISEISKLYRQLIDECTGLNDQVTADILTEITRTLDKNLWLIESHLETA